MSPSWSPDGSRLAYVSFDQKKPIVVVQNLAQGTTRVVANFRGNNSAPAWSPDGRVLAVALSKDGLTQIYRIPADGGRAAAPHRLDRHRHAARVLARRAVDRLHLGPRRLRPRSTACPRPAAQPQRLTFEGSYNVGPRYSPDGKSIAFVQRDDGRYRIATLELATGQVHGAHRRHASTIRPPSRPTVR